MNGADVITPAVATRIIGRGVFIELMRRKDFYVLFILMGLCVLGVLVVSVVGIENPATATFLLNLGMSLAYVAAHLLTLLLAARQLPDELESRSIFPLLARPVSRHTYIMAKWVSCTACGALCLALLMVLGWLPVPKMESFHSLLLMQALILHVVSLGLLAALGLCLSLLVPKGVNITVLGLVIFFGDKVIGLIAVTSAGSAFGGVVRWLAAYLPDFSKLNLITRYTDGIVALGAGEFLGLIGTGVIFTAAALALSSSLFARRPL